LPVLSEDMGFREKVEAIVAEIRQAEMANVDKSRLQEEQELNAKAIEVEMKIKKLRRERDKECQSYSILEKLTEEERNIWLKKF